MNPSGRLADTHWLEEPALKAVLAALGADGAVVRLVGGCVRDALAGRPIGDVDIATPDAPGSVVRLLDRAGLKAVPTGIAHGTITAVSGGMAFEVTTLRRDVETFGRHARVAYTDDWLADAARRDFTINALYADADGTLYDPLGGAADLAAGRVRFVGEAAQRIDEDRLRILRFFRFHARYGRGAPDPEALAAARGAAAQIPALSVERVAAELLKILAAPDPAAALDAMATAGVLAHVLPEGADRARLARLVRLEDALIGADPVRRLAALLSAPGTADRAGGRLRLSNERRARLVAIAVPDPSIAAGMPARPARRLLYRSGAALFADQVLLAWAGNGATPEDAGWRATLAHARDWSPRALPVKGRDLAALGLAAGPAMGAVLDRLEAWWIDRDFAPEHEACMAEARRILAEQSKTETKR
jgi:poly(A) polymerase